MIARPWKYRFVRLSILVALTALGVAAARPAVAGDLAKLDTSLKLIPADAAFYSSMLRNREQFEAVKNSKAVAKIMQMPIVQMGLLMYNAQAQSPGSPLAQFEAALENPESRKIVDLLVDMVSDEVFVYGDKKFVDFVELFQIVNTAQSFGPMTAQITGETEGRSPGQLQGGAVLSALAKNTKLMGLPNVVVGFKLKNADLAKEQLIKLEVIANVVLESNPKTKGHFKKTKVGDYDSLVLDLDGSMIPWDEIPINKFEEVEAAEGDAKKVIEQIKASKLVIALSVRGNYLVASIGSSLEGIEKLGKGERLIDRAEFKPLAKFADKPLVSVGYMSAALNGQLSDQQNNLASLLKLVDQLLPQSNLTDQQKEQVKKDAQALAEDIKTLVPKAGAVMSLSFLADRGVEGYQYSWGGRSDLDGSQPLGLLEHVGGNPILGIVARQKTNPQDYDLLVKWAKTGYGYFKELGLPAIPEKDRAKVTKFLDAAIPLVERMDKANREMLFPALADGQLAFVLDRKLTSDHFVAALPATEKPMPMIEPAIVFGVSNADLLKKGLSEYRAIVNGLIDAVRQIEGSEVPPGFAIPAPKVTEGSFGKIYSFPLPEEWGVDKKIVPNLGLSDKVGVLSITHDHTERLLKATPSTIGGLLEKTDRPLAAAVWFHWAGLLDAAGPWIDFAVDQIMAANSGEKTAADPSVVDQVHTVVDVLKTLRSVTNETYHEDGALVNHTLLEIHDLGK
jgi:hypothetical protein